MFLGFDGLVCGGYDFVLDSCYPDDSWVSKLLLYGVYFEVFYLDVFTAGGLFCFFLYWHFFTFNSIQNLPNILKHFLW